MKRTVSRIKHGLVAACIGDSGKFSYKTSRQQNAEIDRIARYVLKSSGRDFDIIDFFPYGYDERQYCSPGFDLPVGCLMRTPHGEFPEYHTSADNLSFVKPESLSASFEMVLNIFSVLESNKTYLNTNPKGEPQLGKRGLYKLIGGHDDSATFQLAMLWVLNLSDGQHALMDIAERSEIDFYHHQRRSRCTGKKRIIACAIRIITDNDFPKDNTAVITGASSGIGRQIAISLAAAGMRLALLGRNEAALEKVAARAKDTSPQVECYSVDLTSESAILQVGDNLRQDFANIDVLVHSAGIIVLGAARVRIRR